MPWPAHWPRSDTATLPPLDGEDAWHTQGWLGAVLTASKIVDAGDAAAQAARVTAFIRSGIAANRSLIGLA